MAGLPARVLPVPSGALLGATPPPTGTPVLQGQGLRSHRGRAGS